MSDPQDAGVPPTHRFVDAARPAGASNSDVEWSNLVGGLAHEIKNPLSTIRLNLDLLAEELQGEGLAQRKAKRRVDLLQRETQRLQDVLDRFLQFVKLPDYRLEPTDLNHHVQNLLDFYRTQAERNKVELIPYLEPNLPKVKLDRELFRGVVLNLLLNAQQAMPEGGQLVVRTTARDDEVELDLIDTGVGMPPTALSRAFDVFFSTKAAGTGLGLPFAKKVVEGHGGRIELQSEVGRGTRVCIRLPTSPVEPSSETGRPETTEATAPSPSVEPPLSSPTTDPF